MEWIKARVVVQSIVTSAPQLDPANCLKSLMQDVNFLHSDSKRLQNVSALSSFMPSGFSTKWQGLSVVNDVKVMSCLLVVKMKGC